MRNNISQARPSLISTLLIIITALAGASVARAQVKPGDVITMQNADKVRAILSPGAYYAVTRGMGMNIVATSRIDWPPPYQSATEKYSSQVRLASDHINLVGYVAGQPFPILDANDPDVGTKIMWNQYFKPIATDDLDLRFFECQVVNLKPGAAQEILKQTEAGHAGGYSEIGRTEVEPLPADPDFQTTNIWSRSGLYPTLAPMEDRGTGGIRYRYWDPNRADDAWVYLGNIRRVRRMDETIMSSSAGLSTWDADHVGGFNAKPQEYTFKYLGERQMLASAHAHTVPAQPCATDGGATTCGDDWELRHQYMVEVTPRPDRAAGALQSKTVVYVDGEGWFSPYVDSYDRKGELWKSQIYIYTYRDRPVPEARIAVYPFKRQFNIAASSVDVQTGLVTTCYLPGPDTPERECWYINMGAVDKEFFTAEAMRKAGH